ncbi:hypothetical protein P280DRAFT_476979 [Massarina eburnea CBS 473.64]|uniref:Uncharacterized protein n=1 Tax=Massarina eburnea CBS 473.64 TaxID=1395130 RepID=A0A6A6SDU1_9PLEO|nr:hypothetical protein P280DRAFT_476979 [Massarina eburnea CBS 473.64]
MTNYTYPTPPDTPTDASVAAMEAALTEKLTTVGKGALLPYYMELLGGAPKTQGLREAMMFIRGIEDRPSPSDVLFAITRAADLLQSVNGGKYRKSKDPTVTTNCTVTFWHYNRGGDGEKKSHTHSRSRIADIYVRQSVPAQGTEEAGDSAPKVSLISKYKRRTFELQTPRDLFELFVAVLDCEVALVASQTDTQGIIAPKTLRATTLRKFREGDAINNNYLEEAIDSHQDGDLYASIFYLARALDMEPYCTTLTNDIRFRLEHAAEWDLRIVATDATKPINIIIKEQIHQVICQPTVKGRHVLADVFEQILNAYNDEIHLGRNKWAEHYQQNANKYHQAPKVADPATVEGAKCQINSKRKRKERDLRTYAMETSGRKFEERPKKKPRLPSSSKAKPPVKDGRGRPKSPLANEVTLSPEVSILNSGVAHITCELSHFWTSIVEAAFKVYQAATTVYRRLFLTQPLHAATPSEYKTPSKTATAPLPKNDPRPAHPMHGTPIEKGYSKKLEVAEDLQDTEPCMPHEIGIALRKVRETRNGSNSKGLSENIIFGRVSRRKMKQRTKESPKID